MDTPCIPNDEIELLQALHNLGVLDTQPEQCFDRLMRIAKIYFNGLLALLSLVLRDIADSVQSELNHLALEKSAEVIKSSEAKLKDVVDKITEGIITINNEGII